MTRRMMHCPKCDTDAFWVSINDEKEPAEVIGVVCVNCGLEQFLKIKDDSKITLGGVPR